MFSFMPVMPLSIHKYMKEESYNIYMKMCCSENSKQLSIFLLLHDIINNWRSVGKIFNSYKDEFKGMKIILDNSVIELGKPLNVADITEGLNIINSWNIDPKITIVCPDVVCNKKETFLAAIDFIHNINANANANANANIDNIMFVPQGNTLHDWEKSFEELSRLSTSLKIQSIFGIPRNIINRKYTKSRSYIANQNPDKNFHLLGFSNNLLDDISSSMCPNVKSIDTSYVTQLAMFYNTEDSLRDLIIRKAFSEHQNELFWKTPLTVNRNFEYGYARIYNEIIKFWNGYANYIR